MYVLTSTRISSYLTSRDIRGVKMNVQKLESLTGGRWRSRFPGVVEGGALRLRPIAGTSVSGLEMCGSDFAVLEALLHKGPLPSTRLERKSC